MPRCNEVFVLIIMINRCHLKLQLIPDDRKEIHLSLQQCVMDVTRVFFQNDQEILYSSPLKHYEQDLLLLSTLEKDRPIIARKTNEKLKRFEKNSKNRRLVRNYIIQIIDDDEFADHIDALKTDMIWNPRANFLIISATFFSDPRKFAIGIIQDLWNVQAMNSVVLLLNHSSTKRSSYDAFKWYPYSHGDCGDNFQTTSLIDSCTFGIRDRWGIQWFNNEIPKTFNKCTIQVRMINFAPYTINVENDSVGTHNDYFQTKGLDGNLMNVIAERLKLRMHYVSSNIPLNFGNVYDNGTYTGEISYLGNRQADVTIGGFAKTATRNKYLDDSVSYYLETLHWCVPHSPVNRNLDNLLNAITLSAWILIIVFYIIVTFLLWLCGRDGNEIGDYRILGNCVLNSYRLLLNTSVGVLPKSDRSRFVVVLLLLASFYMISAYQTYMISGLSNKDYGEEIETNKDVAESNYGIYVIDDFRKFFNNYDRNDLYMNDIFDKWKPCAGIEQCLDLIALSRNSIVCMPSSSAKFYLNSYVNTRNEPLITCFTRYVISYPVNILMRKGFPLFQSVDDLISLMMTSGLFLKWERDILEGHFRNVLPYDIELSGGGGDLNLFSLGPIFIMLLIGHALALIAFLAEFIHYKWLGK